MLSNFDLYDLADEYSLTLDDICHKNNITNNKKKTNMNIIINLQDSNKGNGTHWVCLIDSSSTYPATQYDSLFQDPEVLLPDTTINTNLSGSVNGTIYDIKCNNIVTYICFIICF